MPQFICAQKIDSYEMILFGILDGEMQILMSTLGNRREKGAMTKGKEMIRIGNFREIIGLIIEV